MKSAKKNTVITAMLVSLSMLLSKAFGMLRDIVLASLYGTGSVEAIAFSTASRIPLLFFDIALGTAVTAAFIPIYNDILKNETAKKAQNFSNKFITLIFIITGVMSLLGIVFSKELALLIAGGLDSEKLMAASFLTKILFPTMITTGVAYCIVGILQSAGEFLIPAIISLVSNLFLVLYMLIFKNRFGVSGVAVAMLIAWSLQVVVQIPSLFKIKYSFRFSNPFFDPDIKKVCLLAMPIIISAWVQPINTVININLASHLNNGAAITSLDYANKLYIILVGVFTYTVTNLIFPSLSKMASSDDNEGYAASVCKSLKYVIFIIIPIMTGFLILSKPVIRVFYERGAFNENSTMLTSKALFFYSMGMIGFAISEIMNKSFYSLKDGKTPMRISIIGIVINILLSIFFVKVVKTGLEGLAFSASVSITFAGFTLLIILNKRMKHMIINKSFCISVLKSVVSSLVMAVCVIVTYNFALRMQYGKLLELALPVAVGACIYALMCIILKSEEFKSLFAALISKTKRGGTNIE